MSPRRASSAAGRRGPVGSLARGLTLLAILASAHRPLGLSELAERAGLDKATTHRLARTLTQYRCVRQDPDTRRYQLAVGVLNLGYAFLTDLDVRELALPRMRSLSDRFHGSVSLAVLDGTEIVYIERLPAAALRVSLEVRVGARLPAHATSMGKAMLAALPIQEIRHMLSGRSLAQLTPNTITRLAALLRDLEIVRRRGFAINDEETAMGLRSAAAVVLDAEGRPVAALNVAVSGADWPRRRVEQEIAPVVLEYATEISSYLAPSHEPKASGSETSLRRRA